MAQSASTSPRTIFQIAYATSFVQLYAEEATRIRGDVLQSPVRDRRLLAVKQPVGPAALITPWNFPSAMITRKVLYCTGSILQFF